ncbi:hypothetical protein Ct61P_13414 [Colletotrichum tofieldiae]|nr:hypothetical protein Ct61P_13414 [Colletotrichum tofieldiae]
MEDLTWSAWGDTFPAMTSRPLIPREAAVPGTILTVPNTGASRGTAALSLPATLTAAAASATDGGT